MYRYSNGQIGLADFKQPVGMNLKESNRWVKKAQTIPWLEIEKRYAALFTNRKGNAAKPLRLALGACIIQAEYGFSDEETALMIQENPYLQYFCGYPGYDDEKLPFDPSLMVYFRKRLTPEVLGEINEMILRDAKARQSKEVEDKDDDNFDDGSGAGGNSGTMIVDATCAPSNIRYPQDVSLLNEARENAEKLLDVLHDPSDGKKPRTYRQRARKDYLKYARCRKHTAKMTRKAIGKQLAYLRRDLDAVDGKLSLGKALSTRQMERLDTIRTIYEQQKYMYDHRTHSVPDRIVSVSQPFVRPIVRGKAGKPVEFGAKLDISVVDGWTRLEFCSFDAYNEAVNLQEMAERFREREGHYPSRILADKIYRNRENLNYCREHGIRLSGPALGRPKKGETRDKTQDYRNECERVEVERRFSLAKRKCGMGLVTARLRETAAHVIAMSVLVLNLRKIQCAFLQLLTYLLAIFLPKGKWAMHLCFVPLTEDKRLCAKEIVGNKKKLTEWQDKFWEHMVKKYPDLERGESASETGRDHIPTRVFKQMTRLTKQMEKLDAMLSDVKLTNYKERTAQIAAFLDKYIPDVAAMETQMKKYEKFFKTADGRQKALERKNADLSAALEESEKESTVKKLQELRLQSDYERVKGILDRIPPEIIRAYTHRDSKTQEVRHYR